MKIEVDQPGVGGDWAKVGKDIRDGDIVKIVDAGQAIEGKFGEQYVFKVRTKDTPVLNLALNRTSRNNLGRGWGTETEQWVNKKAHAFVVKQMVGEGLKNVLYLAPEGWEMTDDGEFVDPKADSESASVGRPIEYPKDDINPDDIPF